MFTEKDMENAIICNPEKYIGEEGLKLITQQFHIGKYIFDLLFEDRHRGKLIVELQKGTLDRNHTYKILDYYDEYKESHPKEFIDLMVIANTIPPERKKRLSALGIAFKEIPMSEVIKDSEEISPTTYQEKNSKISEIRSNNEVNIDDNVMSLYELFKSQKNQFVKALKDYDPGIKIKMDFKDLSE
jgi:RecB family endonuclease NucS